MQHLNLTDRKTVKTCHYPTGRNAERCTTAITKYSPLYYVVYKGEFLCSCNAAKRELGTLQKRVAPVQTGRRGRLARRDRRGNGKRIKQDRRGRTARRTSKQGENDSFREFPTGARAQMLTTARGCGRVACRLPVEIGTARPSGSGSRAYRRTACARSERTETPTRQAATIRQRRRRGDRSRTDGRKSRLRGLSGQGEKRRFSGLIYHSFTTDRRKAQ